MAFMNISFPTNNSNQLLRSLRDLHSPQQTLQLGIPPLDQLLNSFLHPLPREPRSYAQVESLQWNPRSELSKKLKPSVVEIASAAPCAGKRHLLYYIAAASVLPRSYGSTPRPGKEGAVVILDTDSQFDIIRLQDVVSSLLTLRLNACSPDAAALPPSDFSTLLHDAIQHIHVFRPQSPASLLTTLESVPTYLMTSSAHYSPLRPLQTLILTNLNAFFWQTQLESDGGPQSDNKNAHPLTQYYRSVVQELSKVQQIFGCVIVAANQGLSTLQWMRKGDVSMKPYMPGVWNDFCTLKLIVGKEVVRKFGPGISADEAMHEREQRQRAVAESGFWCRVNWWDSAEWDAGVLERLRTLDRGGAFSFHISDTAVTVEDAG